MGNEPSHVEIACRAFELYIQRGDEQGNDDWLQTEMEVKNAQVSNRNGKDRRHQSQDGNIKLGTVSGTPASHQNLFTKAF